MKDTSADIQHLFLAADVLGFINLKHPVLCISIAGTLLKVQSISRVSNGHGLVMVTLCQGLSSLALDSTWSPGETS